MSKRKAPRPTPVKSYADLYADFDAAEARGDAAAAAAVAYREMHGSIGRIARAHQDVRDVGPAVSGRSLTDALLAFGLTHGPSASPGRQQLMLRDATRVGPPVCASTGWQLVRLLKAGRPVSAETVQDAVERAAAAAIRG